LAISSSEWLKFAAIDTGKNTLHLIGLDDQGAIVLREKIARGSRVDGALARTF
jgi:hypothetical protein